MEKLSQKSSRNASPKFPSPMLFDKRQIAEKYYLPSLLERWPDARVIPYQGAFIIATRGGFCLSERDLMEKILPRRVRP